MTTPTRPGGGAAGVGPDSATKIERLVNAFARWCGFAPIAIDGVIDAEDAERAITVQRFLFTRTGSSAAGAARLDRELDELANQARLAGVGATAEQLWVGRHQRQILTMLPGIFRQLAKGG